MNLSLIPLLPAAGAAVNGVIGIGALQPDGGGGGGVRLDARRVRAVGVARSCGCSRCRRRPRVHDVVVAQWIPPMPLETSGGIGSFAVAWTSGSIRCRR